MADKIRRVHCSYHKCLTVYFSKVMRATFNRWIFWSDGFRHFNSQIEDFYRFGGKCEVSSVNNHFLDLESLGDCRVTRFVRDPRDLIVSGYFYHKRGAERWCNLRSPKDADWSVVNGVIPDGMDSIMSFSEYLSSVSQEEGMIAEIDFRARHFASMMLWPDDDPRILTLRYEDVMGSEQAVFRKIFEFYELGRLATGVGVYHAKRYAAGGASSQSKHIRNPKPNQWKQYLSPTVEGYFNDRYSLLIEKLGYERSVR